MNLLYRALRKEEIEKGNILLPKSMEPFKAPLRFPVTFPLTFGDTVSHAIRDHQWDSKFPTRGISTSPLREVAFEKYGKSFGVIANINRDVLVEYGVTEYIVNENIPINEVFAPEDEEIILVYKNEGPLPREINYKVVELEIT